MISNVAVKQDTRLNRNEVTTQHACAGTDTRKRYSSNSFTTPALKGVGTTAPSLYPRERPGTHRTGGWAGLRAVLE